MALPQVPEIKQVKAPALASAAPVITRLSVVAPLYGAPLVMFTPFLFHWYVRPIPAETT